MKLIELLFERFLIKSRFITLLPVIFGLIGSFLLFFTASADVYGVLKDAFDYYILGTYSDDIHENIVGTIVGAVDLYLMALVFYIFSFGIYELFISDVEEFKNSKQSKVLEVHNLDELKDKLGKVIVMVLIVNFFQHVLSLQIKTSTDMLFLAIGILALCLGIFALHKGEHKSNKENK